MSYILCIGDSHDEPGRDQKRFEWLGRLIADRQPTHIVQMGDFLSLDSLSDYDKNKKLIVEGRRFKKELDSGLEAYDKIMAPLRALWKKQQKNKKSKYKPEMVWIVGNHEQRAQRYVQTNSEMAGFISYPDLLGVEKDGWKVVNYKDYHYIDGIGFTHIPMREDNQPLGGKFVTRRVLEGHDHPVVFGHTHRLLVDSMPIKTQEGITDRRVVNVGCYFDYTPDYARGSKGIGDWWSGLVFLDTDISHSNFDVETISYEQMEYFYG